MTTEKLLENVVSSLEDAISDWGMVKYMEYASKITNYIHQEQEYLSTKKFRVISEDGCNDDYPDDYKIAREEMREVSKELDCDIFELIDYVTLEVNQERLNEILGSVTEREFNYIKERLRIQ